MSNSVPFRHIAATPLSGEDVKQYVRDGLLVREHLFSLSEVSELKSEMHRIAREAAISRQSLPISDIELSANLRAVHHPHLVSQIASRHATSEKLVSHVAQLAGAHLRDWDGSAKLIHTMLSNRAPGRLGLNWHQDEYTIPTRDRSLICAWVALDDASEENGAFRMVPRSHRGGYMFPCTAVTEREEFEPHHQTSIGFDVTKAIELPLKAGSVVFFNGYTIHSTRRNRTTSAASAFVCHYASSWPLLPWRVPAGSHAWADDRSVVPVSGVDPGFWRGYKPVPWTHDLMVSWLTADDRR